MTTSSMSSCPSRRHLICFWCCGRRRNETRTKEIASINTNDQPHAQRIVYDSDAGEAPGCTQSPSQKLPVSDKRAVPVFLEQQMPTSIPTRKIDYCTEGNLNQYEDINIDEDDVCATPVNRPSDITINLSVVQEEPSIFTDKSGLESNDDETLISYCFRHKSESKRKKLNLSSKESDCLNRLAGIREF